MRLDFEYIKFRNIKSYGAIEQIVTFKNGINGVFGHNGAGKTTMLDALSFCLFGKPFSDITLPRLLNRRIKKGLFTECKFKSNDDEFIITRTMKPDSITILKNGDPVKLKSSKKLVQSEIDKVIGINHYMFHHAISLALNANQPFISMKVAERREVVDNIFNIVVFSEMTAKLKLKRTDVSTRFKVFNDRLNYVNNELDSLNTKLTQAINSSTDRSSEWTDRIDVGEKNIGNAGTFISESELRIKFLGESINTIMEKYPADRFNELNDDMGKVAKSIIELESKLNHMSEKKSFMVNNNQCPKCGQGISDEMKNDQDLSNGIQALHNRIYTMRDIQSTIQTTLFEFNSNYSDVRSIQQEIQSLTNNIRNAQYTMDAAINDIAYAKSMIKNVVVAETDWIEKSIAEKQGGLEEANANVAVTQRELSLIEKSISLLSETGIKAYFLEKLIPMLNSRINFYLESFKLPVIVRFDKFLEANIETIDSREDNDYSMFSGGEKKRVDIAIFLSFIDVTKRITDWNCNLLIFDEIFDSAMDDEGIEDVMKSLRDVFSVNQMCIYVITHRAQNINKNLLNGSLHMERVGNFSNIVES